MKLIFPSSLPQLCQLIIPLSSYFFFFFALLHFSPSVLSIISQNFCRGTLSHTPTCWLHHYQPFCHLVQLCVVIWPCSPYSTANLIVNILCCDNCCVANLCWQFNCMRHSCWMHVLQMVSLLLTLKDVALMLLHYSTHQTCVKALLHSYVTFFNGVNKSVSIMHTVWCAIVTLVSKIN